MKIHHHLKKLLSRSVLCPALTLMSAALALPGHADSFTVDGIDQPWAPVSDKVTVEDVADADTVIIVDGINSDTTLLYTGYATGGEVSGNALTVSNSTLKDTHGAYIMGTGTAHHNSLTLDNSTFSKRVYGADVQNSQVDNIENTVVAAYNSLTIEGNTYLKEGAVAANANYGILENNTLLVENATVSGAGWELIAARIGNQGTARNNTLIVKNSTISGHKVLATALRSGDAEYNTIIIENSTIIGGSIAAGNTINGKAINNTVILRGNCTIEASILVGDGQPNTQENEITGNTLRLEGFTGSVNAVYNFKNINITLKDWDPSQYVLETVVPLDLAGKNVTLEAIESVAEGATMPTVGKELKLFSNATNEATANLNILPEYRNVKYGRTRLIDLQFDVDETTGAVTFDSEGGLAGEVVNVHLNPQFKALAEGRVAALSFTNRAGNLAAEQGMEQAGRAAAVEGTRMATFMAMSAGHDRVDSGSHVDADGVATMLGVSAGMLREKALTLGGFIEGGWGQYTTHNSFADMPDVRGKGESSYAGGGVLARYAFHKGKMKGLALEASFRAGKQDTDFSGSDRNGEFAGYELSNSYLAGHLGVAYTFSACKRFENTVYARYFWSHLGSDTASLWEGDSIHFDATHSNRLRFGARTTWKASAKWTPYAGLAYEWECSGAARSTVDNEHVAAPSMRGGSVMAELGTTWQPLEEKPLWFHGGIQGSAGKTQGYGANIGCTVAF